MTPPAATGQVGSPDEVEAPAHLQHPVQPGPYQKRLGGLVTHPSAAAGDYRHCTRPVDSGPVREAQVFGPVRVAADPGPGDEWHLLVVSGEWRAFRGQSIPFTRCTLQVALVEMLVELSTAAGWAPGDEIALDKTFLLDPTPVPDEDPWAGRPHEWGTAPEGEQR